MFVMRLYFLTPYPTPATIIKLNPPSIGQPGSSGLVQGVPAEAVNDRYRVKKE